MISTAMRVALLENDHSFAQLLTNWLAFAGYRCFWHERGQSLAHALRQETSDVLIMNGNPPDVSGTGLLRHVRNELQSSLPILFVTAGEDEDDVVTALRQGADDCMTKPVRRMELLARLEAITRRGRLERGQPEVIDLGSLRIDCRMRTAQLNDRPVKLTAKDFDLSVLFLRNVGRLLHRSWLRETVWGPKAVVSSRTLDTHVCRIRHRLRLTPHNGWRLAAVYGYGYRLQQTELSAGRGDCDAAVLSGLDSRPAGNQYN
jgi:DNA-binding response OmpR family regulator